MNKKSILAIVGVAVVAAVGFAGYGYLQLQAEAKKWAGPYKEIAEEKFGKDGSVTTASFVSIVEYPVADVERALFEPERSQEMVANISLSRLVKAETDSKIVEMHLRALNLPLQHYTMRFTRHPGEHRISFKTVESQTQDIEGEYRLEASPDGKRTRIAYTSRSLDKIVLPFPQSVVDSANRETFVNTIRGLKKALQQQTG
jgi:hypothetical protein